MVNGKQYPAKAYYQTIGGDALGGYYNYDATNVRLQELSLGYSFDGKALNNIGINRLTLSVIGTNLWMIYNKAPFDPEIASSTGTYGQGSDYFSAPSLRNIGFSLKLNF